MNLAGLDLEYYRYGGNSIIDDVIKYSHLNTAQSKSIRSNWRCTRFRTELSDVSKGYREISEWRLEISCILPIISLMIFLQTGWFTARSKCERKSPANPSTIGKCAGEPESNERRVPKQAGARQKKIWNKQRWILNCNIKKAGGRNFAIL